jgi:DME family drug/metabolite transporter
VLAVGASLVYALYVVLAKAVLVRTSPLPMAAVNFAVAALVLAPMLATAGVSRQLVLGWSWMLYLGAVTTAGAYAIYTLGLRHVSASSAGIVALVEPLTATLLGVFLFGERLGVAGAIGAVLLFAALGLLVSRDARVSRGSSSPRTRSATASSACSPSCAGCWARPPASSSWTTPRPTARRRWYSR